MDKFGLALGALALSLSACSSTGSTSSNAGIGAALGAAAGAGIAAATGSNVLVGAAVGGVAGAGAGVLLSEVDREKTRGDKIAGACAQPDLSVGSSVPGKRGAAWADLDLNGCVDGYIEDGRYYQLASRG